MAAAAASPADLPLTALRNLADRSFDKRKLGAVECEKVVRGLKQAGNKAALKRVVALLAQDFAGSPNSNNRKGGLIGLASCAIALTGGMEEHLDVAVPAVLRGLADSEARVRYYACESLFNISKVCRGAMVPHFNDIFSGLCKLVADVDQDCRNGAGLLDRLLKEIVLEREPGELQGAFLGHFVPLLKAHMAASSNPYVRQTLIGWIVALDSVPGVDLCGAYSVELLGGLFAMLSDGNREVRSAAYAATSGFLDQLDASSESGGDWAGRTRFLQLLDTLVAYCGREREPFARLTAVEWIAHILARPAMRAVLAPAFDRLASTLLRCMADAGAGASGSAPAHVGGGVAASGEAELADLCGRANGDLADLVRSTPEGGYDAPALVRSVTGEAVLCNSNRSTRAAALRWTGQLLGQCPAAVLACLDAPVPAGGTGGGEGEGGPPGPGLLDCLLRNLLPSEGGGAGEGEGGKGGGPSPAVPTPSDVLKLALEVLARIAVTQPPLLRSRLLVDIVRLLATQRSLLEGRAAFIIRRLSLLLEPSLVYLSLASILTEAGEGGEGGGTPLTKDFTSLLVELLNLLLLTAVELGDFRDSLRGCAGSPASPPAAVFVALYKAWVHNPVAALSLCLHAQAFEAADLIVASLGEGAITLGLLMQLDKLVQLLESPIFLATRLRLCDTAEASAAGTRHLLSALYGLLMLLPQGAAYNTLRDRLGAVTALHTATGSLARALDGATAGAGGAGTGPMDPRALFAIFARCQAAARSAASSDLRSRSLLLSGGGEGAAVAAAPAPAKAAAESRAGRVGTRLAAELGGGGAAAGTTLPAKDIQFPSLDRDD